MQSTADYAFSTRAMLEFFYKYRQRLLKAFFIPFILACIFALLSTPRYPVTTVLTVRLGAEYFYQPETGYTQSSNRIPVPFNAVQIFKTEQALLQSHDLHLQVIYELGIARIFPEIGEASFINSIKNHYNNLLVAWGLQEPISLEMKNKIMTAKALDMFEKRLDVALEKDSSVITVTFEHKNTEIAVEILQHLLKQYFAMRKTVYHDENVAMARQNSNASEQRMQEVQKQLADFKRHYKIDDFLQQRTALLDRRNKALEQASLINNAGLNQRIAGYNGQLATLAQQEGAFTLLQKQAETAQQSSALYAYRLHEAEAMEAASAQKESSVRVIEQPFAPAEPRSWRLIILLCGGCTGFLMGCITASWIQLRDDKINGIHDITGIIGHIALDNLPYYDSTPVTLPYRNILDKGMIAFISARGGEGVSFTAFHYARSLASEGTRKILLLDAGKFNAHNYAQYGIIPKHTIVNAVTQGNMLSNAVYRVNDTLAVARLGENYTFILFSLWQELQALYDIIIIDTGSLAHCVDAVRLAANADAVVMVAQANQTRKPVLKNLCEALLGAGAKIAGVIVNKKKHYIPEAMYRKLVE